MDIKELTKISKARDTEEQSMVENTLYKIRTKSKNNRKKNGDGPTAPKSALLPGKAEIFDKGYLKGFKDGKRAGVKEFAVNQYTAG